MSYFNDYEVNSRLIHNDVMDYKTSVAYKSMTSHK